MQITVLVHNIIISLFTDVIFPTVFHGAQLRVAAHVFSKRKYVPDITFSMSTWKSDIKNTKCLTSRNFFNPFYAKNEHLNVHFRIFNPCEENDQ